MTRELPKGYEPKDVEERWRSFWEESRTFTPDVDGEGDPYSIVIPPPNVTGALHMGHALNITIQDILCRYHRQQGRNVLWVPGTDHAGIATQNVVERQLKTEGKSRHDLGREKFIERVWEWRKEYGDRILNQVRHLGASVDWTRERFTLDEGLNKAVRSVFVRLYKEGLIYKGDYIINWCNRCHTALADDEVEHAPKKGALHQLKYPLEKPRDGVDGLIVATTRPETMLGDTAVAVHPEDERYNHLIGEYVVLPLLNRRIPIIGDNYVDIEFGTGCLKVTPGHDMNDWQLGEKHNLDVLSVIDEDGNMNELAGEAYQGMSKEDCRARVLEDLKALGLLIGIEEYDHSVGHCYRCKSVIEPHVSTQWFVAVKTLAEKARNAVPGDTQIYPETWMKTYYNWLDNIRDWCISRQIWWGHRIPAWTCEACGELIVQEEPPTVCACGATALVQDEDVLDTWFSSALWPFSTLGWPDETKDLAKYYPTSVLVTGFDILFFWVARMMMMGIHFQEEIPFKHVYIHALVRDAEGKKMSKSTGNVIDPLEMIEKYGADSLRFTLTAFAAMGRDIKLAEDRIEGYRHFVNKLWNAARFTLMNLPEEMPEPPAGFSLHEGAAVHHAWIFHRLEQVRQDMGAALDGYHFNEAAQTLYKFIWHEFCDWYVEMLKPELYSDDEELKTGAQIRLWTVLKDVLTLMHPIMPFVTQEIWDTLPSIENRNLAQAPFPEARPEVANDEAVAMMTLVQDVVTSVRNIRGELNIAPSLELELLIRTASDTDKARIEENAGMIKRLARLKNLELGPDTAAPKASASAVVGGNELFVPLSGAVNFDDELARLNKELGKIDKELGVVTKKLANKGFVDKAPAAVVQKERDKQDEYEEKKEKLLALKTRLEDAMG